MAKNEIVIADWATQSEKRRASKNVRSNGTRLVNYATVIAQIHDTNAGRIALFTSNRYSSSTSTVQGIARGAIKRLGIDAIEVPDVSGDDRAGNLKFFETAAKSKEEQAKRARPDNVASYLAEADLFRKTAKRYAKFFPKAK